MHEAGVAGGAWRGVRPVSARVEPHIPGNRIVQVAQRETLAGLPQG
jgi:hypothetical protein